jgi:hypothetical protein
LDFSIFGINSEDSISRVVHELTEKECLEYFSIVKAGIELILDDEIERISKLEKIATTKKAIEAIQSELGSSS